MASRDCENWGTQFFLLAYCTKHFGIKSEWKKLEEELKVIWVLGIWEDFLSYKFSAIKSQILSVDKQIVWKPGILKDNLCLLHPFIEMFMMLKLINKKKSYIKTNAFFIYWFFDTLKATKKRRDYCEHTDTKWALCCCVCVFARGRQLLMVLLLLLLMMMIKLSFRCFPFNARIF